MYVFIVYLLFIKLIEVGPSVVVVDEGVAKSLTTTTAKEEIYAFFFDQKGLMVGFVIQGSKFSPITT